MRYLRSPPSLFIFVHDFRMMVRTRRGGAARRPNGRINLSFSPPLFLRKKRAQKTYGLAATAEVKLQAMREQPPFGPAQRLPAGSGKRSRPGREGESLPLSSPSRPGLIYRCEFINLLKSEGGPGSKRLLTSGKGFRYTGSKSKHFRWIFNGGKDSCWI